MSSDTTAFLIGLGAGLGIGAALTHNWLTQSLYDTRAIVTVLQMQLRKARETARNPPDDAA